MNKLTKFISKLTLFPCYCEKCGTKFSVFRDPRGTDWGYPIYYCPKCDGDIESEFYKNLN